MLRLIKYAFDAALNKKMNNDSNKCVVSKLSEIALIFVIRQNHIQREMVI